jgi:thioredoxin-like negative regulator of GroEL
LAVVVDRAEADLVVAFVDGAVVDEFRGVKEVEAVHATAA